jgi:hypothetical protein
VRNLVSHWTARRIPNEDTIMLTSKDESDAKQIRSTYLDTGRVSTAILDLADLRAVFDQVTQIELWLAAKISEWHKRYVGD